MKNKITEKFAYQIQRACYHSQDGYYYKNGYYYIFVEDPNTYKIYRRPSLYCGGSELLYDWYNSEAENESE